MSGSPLIILIINAVIMVLMGVINPHISRRDKARLAENQFPVSSKPNIHLDYHYNQILALFVSYFLILVATVIFFANGDFSSLVSHLGNNVSAKIFVVIVILILGAIINVVLFGLEIVSEEIKFRILKRVYGSKITLIK